MRYKLGSIKGFGKMGCTRNLRAPEFWFSRKTILSVDLTTKTSEFWFSLLWPNLRHA
jgi:hypothetical protein